jgi:hypothetical protein
MPRLRLQRTALGTRLRSLRERPLEQRHLRAALVLLAGLGLSALGFAAVGPSLGAFTAKEKKRDKTKRERKIKKT